MARTAVYTAVTGSYDPLKRHPDVPGVDFIAFTDNPAEAERMGWEPRPFDYVGNRLLSPRMVAKYPKLLPHRALPEYDATLWVDASHRILSPDAVTEPIYMAINGATGFVLHKHPWRACIYQEAVASLELWKYNSEPIEEQVAAYRADGHPEHWGLWACGSMARVNGERVNAAMEQWWQECLAWSYQDQLSLPVVMREAGWRPDEFPHHQVHSNPWFSIAAHPKNNE